MSLQTTALQTQQRPRLLHVIANQCLAPADTRHVSTHLARHVLATADTCPSSACHCEPVRTLVWQSVLPAEKPSNLALLRANPYALSRIRPKYCSPLRPTAGVTDCHVASLLAMTGGEVSLRTSALPPLTPGMFPRTLRPTSLHPRTRPSFCMSLRTSAHTGAAIRFPAAIPGKHVELKANSLRLAYSPKVLLHCYALSQGKRIVPSLRSSQWHTKTPSA